MLFSILLNANLNNNNEYQVGAFGRLELLNALCEKCCNYFVSFWQVLTIKKKQETKFPMF